MLDDFKCDLAQGFYMARPMPAGELVDWMEQDRFGLSQGSNDQRSKDAR